MVLSLPAAAQEYLVHRYTEKDHLPSLSVTGVAQDPEGRMVFSTRGGLVRYDGTEWTVLEVPARKVPRSFRHVRFDERGVLWALEITRPFQLASYDGEQWYEHPNPLPMDWGWDVLDMDVDSSGDGPSRVAVASYRRFAFWDGVRWQDFGKEHGLEGIRAMGFHDGVLYFATAHGVMVFEGGSAAPRPLEVEGLPPGPIHAIDPGDETWVVGDDWLGRIVDGRFVMEARDLDLYWDLNEAGAVAARGPDGDLFFGDYLILHHYHPERGLRPLGKETGLVSDGSTRLFLDREDNLWITNFRGISKLVSMRLQSFDRSGGLADDEVTSVCERADGSMVLGHAGALTFLDPDPRILRLNRDMPGNGRVIQIIEDRRDQSLWIVADKWGLAHLDGAGRLRWLDEDTGLEGQAFATFQDREDRIWVGGSEGLYRLENGRFTLVPFIYHDPNVVPFVRRIDEDLEGNLLVSTGMLGAFHIQGDKIDRWSNRESGLIRSCYDVLDLGEGRFWVGTSAGLCRLHEGRLIPTQAPDPVLTRPIYCLMKDREGHVWMGTDVGVFRWDGEDFTNLDTSDGLPGREFNRDALHQARDGRIWMGTDKGLGIFDPVLDHPRTAPPLVRVDRPLVDGLLSDELGTVELSPAHFALEIPFRGVSFLDENRLQFRTWLEGFEPQWGAYARNPSGTIRYTNLGPGQYRFHIQALNAAGVASEVITSSPFTVGKPLSRTWWFILLKILAGLLLVGSVAALILGRRYQARLRDEVKARTRDLESSEMVVRSESLRLSSILASISDGVLALDPNLEVILSNPTARAILGRDEGDIQGRPLSEVMPLEPPLQFDRKPGPGFGDKGNPAIPTHVYRTPDDDSRTLEISRFPLEDAEAPEGGWVVAFRDITDRLRLQQETMRTQQLESLGVLAGGIAHDFNNLLTIMLGNLSLVEAARGLPEDTSFRLDRMKKAAERARGLAEQLLTFAKGGDPVMQSVDLGQLVEQAVTFALSGSRVTSRVHIEKTLWKVKGDPGQLTQVVNNLVINAMQAMPEGGIMRVKMNNVWSLPGPEGPRPGVSLEVKDEGQGIEARDMERIFNPYFTTKGQGSGLGLTIAHSIVTNHGGTIEAESQPERGTQVRVTLPASDQVSTEPRGHGGTSFPADMRVLVLDDEKDVLIMCEQILLNMGLQCVGVMDGEEAVEAYARSLGQNRPFSVFLADLTIPGGMGGVEALKKIREMDPTVVGIVFSGYSNDPVMTDFQEYGFDGAINKPFSLDTLTEVLAGAMDRGRIRRS